MSFNCRLTGIPNLLHICRWQELVVFGVEQMEVLSCLRARQHAVSLIINKKGLLEYFWNKFLVAIV